MEYGLIGEHLGHSFSKEIHNRIADYDYILKEIEPWKLTDFITAREYRGLNVTIPYKQAVIELLDYVDEAALDIGAVNTIVNRDGRLYGYNTDYLGMRELILNNGMDLQDATVLILGSGGTSKTAYKVAESLGAKEIIKVSRHPKNGEITYEEAYRDYSYADAIINTTPCGMYPETNGCPIDISRFTNLRAVVDAIYNPLNTRLVLSARQRGIKASGGLYMLVAQAVKASELFFDTTYDPAVLDNIFRSMEGQKKNIVLIGMPGCGKSTIGIALRDRLNREFIDSDAEIVKRAGREIPQIFSEYGEKYFRKLESEVIFDLSKRTGIIIATGGGAVINNKNVEELKKNGELIWLNRPIEGIVPTDDRPLSNDRDKLIKLFAVREPIYRAAADREIDACDSIEGIVERIGSMYEHQNN